MYEYIVKMTTSGANREGDEMGRRHTRLAAGLMMMLWAPLALAQQPPTSPPSAQEIAAAEWKVVRLGQEAVRLYDAGDYGAALTAAERAYAIAQQTLPRENPLRLTVMNNLAVLYQSQGRYGDAEPLYDAALRLSRAVLGERHPDTLTNLNNLAALYYAQGRYGDAEPLYEQALRLRREVLGKRHPDTLTNLNNLAALYYAQGRYGDAEPLYEQGLRLSREVLGERHPQTLTNLNNLAELYKAQGRYGKAEPLYNEALRLSREALGEHHLQTLQSLNNLAVLYQAQGRYGDAEPLLKEALRLRREVLGERHPNTLGSLNNLAALYQAQGRYGEAEPLLEQALRLTREVLGERHPQMLTSLNNLAALYYAQGRYGDAEPLFEEALRLHREALGEHHPDTLVSLNNLAGLYQIQGRYGEAEPRYEQALGLRREVLGERHPDTLSSLNNLAGLYVAQGNAAAAAQRFREALTVQRGRAMAEQRAAQGRAQRRGAAQGVTNTRDFILTLARDHLSTETAGLAADALLALKGVQGEYETALRRAAQRLNGPDAALTDDLRRTVAARDAAERSGAVDQYRALADDVDQLEAQITALLPDSAFAGLQDAPTWKHVAIALPDGAALVEYQVYEPIDFSDGSQGADRLAAVVLRSGRTPAFHDLGEMADIRRIWGDVSGMMGQLLDPPDKFMEPPDFYLTSLSTRLTEPFADDLAGADTVFIAPDDVLHTLPFDMLRFEDGGPRWGETQTLRILPTGRALLARPSDAGNDGRFFAVGGPDYGPAWRPGDAPHRGDHTALVRSATDGKGWRDLPGARREAELLTELFRARGLPASDPLLGADASEAAIREVVSVPRVMHLATHADYAEADSENELQVARRGRALAAADDPLARTVVVFAGANIGGPSDNDGLMFGTDIARLVLDGMDLAALSACEAGLGTVGRGEGVMSLSHAFRLAGVRNVIMTYWVIPDAEAQAFMADFYSAWLDKPQDGPGAALRAIKQAWMQGPHANPFYWAGFGLIENTPLQER